MSLAVVVGIGLLGGLGAVARFRLAGAVGVLWGTLAVNLSGAFLLGLLVGAGADGALARLAGTGFLGAYTTFSTWALESHRLGGRPAALNLVGSLVLGVALAGAGSALGGLL